MLTSTPAHASFHALPKHRCTEQVHVAEFSPYNDIRWSKNDYLAWGGESRVTILKRAVDSAERWMYTEEQTVPTGSPVKAIAWAPITKANFCLVALCANRKIYHIRDEEQIGLPMHHQDDVNDVAISFMSDDLVASVSDDRTLRIHDISTSDLITIHLTSPGTSVQFNAYMPETVLVAERCGAIRMWDYNTRTMVFSLHEITETVGGGVVRGLRGVEWCPGHANEIGAVVSDKWQIWKLDNQAPVHLPYAVGDAHTQGAKGFRWARDTSHALAFAVFTDTPERSGSSGDMVTVLKMFPEPNSK
ncbi:Nucleoporin Nup37, partial [Borealophlyctis nickersoniae]